MLRVKQFFLDYMSGIPGRSIPKSQVESCTAGLRQFLAGPTFEDEIARARDHRFTRITIVMPSYNKARFIERSILSVLNQNYPNLQFIIMDGGSTDGTLDVIRKYEKYLLWRSEPDRGQSDAINKGLIMADGEIVGWQNSDDVYFPGVFHRIHTIARKRRRVAVFSGSVAQIDSTDRLMRVPRYVKPTRSLLLYGAFPMESQGVFWRRELEPEPILCDPDLHYKMDFDLWLKLLAHGDAEFLPELVGGFRFYEGTKTASAPERLNAESEVVMKKYGIDPATTKWRVMRGTWFVSNLIQRTFVTRRHCVLISPDR
jgi:glycosyltransferase involved in cell wall biosynthesis